MCKPSLISLAALLSLCCTVPITTAQTSRAARPGPGTVDHLAADRYDPVLEGLRSMTAGERAAPVRNLTLRRDVITFHLEDGMLVLATPVAGRTVGATFVGRGSISFTPPLAIERVELLRLLGDSTVQAQISAAAFVFTDSTLAELQRQLEFEIGRAHV